jgi:molecular chaperone HscB
MLAARRVFGYRHNRCFSAKSGSGRDLSCPACKSQEIQIKDDLFCCKTCPNRQGIDYFRLLGLPVDYSIDMKHAEDAYKTLQKKYHPDTIQDDVKKTLPEGYSSLLNKAIRVIKSPTERALHLLYILDGCSISESDLTNDPSLLMEMMELNEDVDDCGRDVDCLSHLEDKNQAELVSCEHRLRELFKSRDYKGARKVCERMHYLERIRNTISKKLQK